MLFPILRHPRNRGFRLTAYVFLTNQLHRHDLRKFFGTTLFYITKAAYKKQEKRYEKIEIISSHDCNIVMDAQVVKTAGFEEPITIKKYKKPAVFLRLKQRGLRQMSKLGF